MNSKQKLILSLLVLSNILATVFAFFVFTVLTSFETSSVIVGLYIIVFGVIMFFWCNLIVAYWFFEESTKFKKIRQVVHDLNDRVEKLEKKETKE